MSTQWLQYVMLWKHFRLSLRLDLGMLLSATTGHFLSRLWHC